ncbi:MAG TPA: hypothetical protein VFC19_22560 [Candidatus Limnocylindrales bacterium]|nr:hypothetical protein [Candidatus Limnocylindrales bacterium]
MKFADIVQAVSFLAVIIALMLSVWQNKEAARQTSSVVASLRQATHEELIRHGLDFTYEALTKDPELLAWFLTSRGFPPGNEAENRKRLFLFARFDMHDATYHAFITGATAEDVWCDWLPTVRLDLAMREAPAVWNAIRSVFSPNFAAVIDDLLAEQASRSASTTA